MKRVLILALFFLFAGCATTNSPDITVEATVSDTAKEAKPSKSIPNTNSIIPEDTAVLWLVVQFDEFGRPLQKWFLRNGVIFFLEEGQAIGFVDEVGDVIVLREKYAFMLIRVGDWFHPNYFEPLEDKKALENGKDKQDNRKKIKNKEENKLIVKKDIDFNRSS